MGAVRGDAVLLRVDGLRVMPDEGVAARLGDCEVPVLATADVRRAEGAGDFDRAFGLGEEVFAGVSREGVEERVGLSVIFAAGFRDGRLGFLVAALAGSFPVSFAVVGLFD